MKIKIFFNSSTSKNFSFNFVSHRYFLLFSLSEVIRLFASRKSNTCSIIKLIKTNKNIFKIIFNFRGLNTFFYQSETLIFIIFRIRNLFGFY